MEVDVKLSVNLTWFTASAIQPLIVEFQEAIFVFNIVQWSLRTMDTLGAGLFFHCREVPLSGRLTHNLVLPLSTLYRLLLKHISGHSNLA